MERLYTFSLVQCDDLKRPIGYASGCIIRFKGHLFLLTVSHATGNMGNWAVEGAYVKEFGTQLFPLGQMSFLSIGRLNKRKRRRVKIEEEEVDFSYKHLSEPIPARYQEITVFGGIIVDEPKQVLETDFSFQANNAEEYSFWGLTKPTDDGLFFNRVPKREDKMKFTKEEGNLLFFRTQAAYKSYEEFKGCSGAPILDSKGNLVSLVVEGDKKKTGIYGLNLPRFSAVFEVEILQLSEPDHIKEGN